MENEIIIWEQNDTFEPINHTVIKMDGIDAYAVQYANQFIYNRITYRKYKYKSHKVENGRRTVYITLTYDDKECNDYILRLCYRINNYPTWQPPNRKIEMKLINPTGETIKSVKADYFDLCHAMPPEDYPSGHEPMKRNRYILSVGDHEYMISRDGQIIEQISRPDDIFDEPLFPKNENKEKTIKVEKLDSHDLLRIIRTYLDSESFRTSATMYDPTDFENVSFVVFEKFDKKIEKVKFTVSVKQTKIK